MSQDAADRVVADRALEALPTDPGEFALAERGVLRLEFQDRPPDLRRQATLVARGRWLDLEEAAHAMGLKAGGFAAQRALRHAGVPGAHRRRLPKEHDGAEQLVGFLFRRGDEEADLRPVVGRLATRSDGRRHGGSLGRTATEAEARPSGAGNPSFLPRSCHAVNGPHRPSMRPAGVKEVLARRVPVAMALATGVEAPSSAIAQLGQLDDAGRVRFGRVTLWLTLGIVGSLTLGLTVLAHRLNVGLPANDSTQIADIARRAVGSGRLFSLFQLTSAFLLLAAASSSFQAGPGLLKALAAHGGLLPRPLATTNTYHTPFIGVAVFALVAATVLIAADGRDQVLVLFYAVAVFVSFLAGLLAMARFAARTGHRSLLMVNLIGAVIVAFVLLLNLARGYPVASLAAALAIAGALYGQWVRTGRPTGVSGVEAEAEAEEFHADA